MRGSRFCIVARRQIGPWVRENARPIGKVLAAGAVGFAVGIVPFFWIYLPVLAIVPGRTWREYIMFAPTVKDLFNFSPGNLLWGWTTHVFSLGRGHEYYNAITPILTAATVVLTYRLRKRERAAGIMTWQSIFATSCIVTWLVSWLLTMKIGTVSVFWLVFQAAPGATAIRAGGRIQLVVNIWIVLALAVLLTHWIQTVPAARRMRVKMTVVVIVMLCLTEQFNRLDAAQLPRAEKLRRIELVTHPPAEFRVFLVDPMAPAPEDRFYETDAMGMTIKTGLPTLNGMSGWQPPGWRLQVPGVDYFTAVREWIALKSINEPVCLSDRTARRWSPFK